MRAPRAKRRGEHAAGTGAPSKAAPTGRVPSPCPFPLPGQAGRKLRPRRRGFVFKSNLMKINAIDIKPGNVLEHQGKLWVVLKRELIQPGKGGSFAQVEMRDFKTGTKTNERYRTQETVERVQLDEKDMTFLFLEGAHGTFMDTQSAH